MVGNRLRSVAVLALLLSVGCASSGPGTLDQAQIARELRSRGLDPDTVVVPFEMTDEMREWAHRLVPNATAPEKRLAHEPR
jgi:hypothetical protein